MYRNRPGELLWEASPERAQSCRLADFMRWLENRHQRPFATYEALWQWSVDDLEGFWVAVWEYFEVQASSPYREVLSGREMPGAQWFTGARLNWAEHALRYDGGDGPALIAVSEDGGTVTTSWAELRAQVAALAASLRELGVRPGDRVAGVLPNIPHAVVALLATASLGAVWGCADPALGPNAIISRLSQLRPAVLIVCDGYHFGGEPVDRRGVAAAVRAAMPGTPRLIMVSNLFPELDPPEPLADAVRWADVATAGQHDLTFEQVDFDHPLWVLFTSGTTGAPKAIVHGHGGIVVEAFKMHALMFDLRAGDRMLFTSSTAWVAWNLLVTILQVGACAVLFEGDPAYPDPRTLWRAAEELGIRVMGFGSSYVGACQSAGLQPGTDFDLSSLDLVIVTGSPLPVDGWHWVYEAVARDVRLTSASGGTEVLSAFAGGTELLPVYATELGPAWPGVQAEAWDDGGRPIVGEMAELVIRAPMPSMPVSLWNDPTGSRFRDTYFDLWPGVWRHGDWCTVTERGTFIIHGRADATVNRNGTRVATTDIYEVVERLPEVAESLAVGVDSPDGSCRVILFVVPAGTAHVDEVLRGEIAELIRTEVSPQAVPDEIVEAPGIPHTVTGKRLEVPVKRLLQGALVDSVVNLGAVDSPGTLLWFADFARSSLSRAPAPQS